MEAPLLAPMETLLHREWAVISSGAAPILLAFLLAAALHSIGFLKTLKDFNRMMSQIRYCVTQ